MYMCVCVSTVSYDISQIQGFFKRKFTFKKLQVEDSEFLF